MGLFTPNYVKPGPGIDKDARPKTGLALFFEIFIREFWALAKLNVLFLLTCTPIVTIGAAMGAMTKVTVRMVRDIPNDAWYDYWRGFRENWKASTVLGLVTALVYGGGLLGLVLYPAGSAIWLITLAALLILTMVWLYLYPLLTSTTLSFWDCVRDAILLAILRFYYSFPVALLILALIALEIMFFPLSIPATLLVGCAIPNFIASFLAWSGIQKHVLPPEKE